MEIILSFSLTSSGLAQDFSTFLPVSSSSTWFLELIKAYVLALWDFAYLEMVQMHCWHRNLLSFWSGVKFTPRSCSKTSLTVLSILTNLAEILLFFTGSWGSEIAFHNLYSYCSPLQIILRQIFTIIPIMTASQMHH